MDTSAIAKNVFDETLGKRRPGLVWCCCMFYPRKKRQQICLYFPASDTIQGWGGRNLEIFYQAVADAWRAWFKLLRSRTDETAAGVSTEFTQKPWQSGRTICELANCRADLCNGTSGSLFLSEFILGSVAIMFSPPCSPVLFVTISSKPTHSIYNRPIKQWYAEWIKVDNSRVVILLKWIKSELSRSVEQLRERTMAPSCSHPRVGSHMVCVFSPLVCDNFISVSKDSTVYNRCDVPECE